MPITYLFTDFTKALLRNLAVYLEPGEDCADQLEAQLSLTRDKETAMSVYRSTVRGFKDSVYFETDEDSYRLLRHEDLLDRWQARRNTPARKEALERLIVTFDTNNYAPPPSMRIFY